MIFNPQEIQRESWKDIVNYKGLYKVSDLGRVKSLKNGNILKGTLSGKYLTVSLCDSGNQTTYRVHTLVAIHFKKHNPSKFKKVIDHIDGNKTNNRLSNLRIVTQRKNCSNRVGKSQGRYSSKYVGVGWRKDIKKWCAAIVIERKRVHLGYFENEYNAHLAYQGKLKEINISL